MPRRRRAPFATRSTEARRRSNSRAHAPETNTHTHKQTSRTFAGIRAGTRLPLRWGHCGRTQCVGSATNAASLLCKILHTQSMHRWLRPVAGGAAVGDGAKAEASFAAPHGILHVSVASRGSRRCGGSHCTRSRTRRCFSATLRPRQRPSSSSSGTLCGRRAWLRTSMTLLVVTLMLGTRQKSSFPV